AVYCPTRSPWEPTVLESDRRARRRRRRRAPVLEGGDMLHQLEREGAGRVREHTVGFYEVLEQFHLVGCGRGGQAPRQVRRGRQHADGAVKGCYGWRAADFVPQGG